MQIQSEEKKSFNALAIKIKKTMKIIKLIIILPMICIK